MVVQGICQASSFEEPPKAYTSAHNRRSRCAIVFCPLLPARLGQIAHVKQFDFLGHAPQLLLFMMFAGQIG